MKKLEKIIVSPKTSLLEVLKVIDETALEIALVADSKRRLLGTATDGDIRRAILKNVPLSEAVSKIMNTKAKTVAPETPEDEVLFLMTKHSIKQVPVIDGSGRIVDLKLLKEIAGKQKRDNWAVIMAGGLGKRLGKLTRKTPKPLLQVGDRPLLGIIVNQLRKHGIFKIFVSVNYRSEQIKNYLGNGRDFDVEINYLEEKEFLGTAGPIKLLPEKPQEPFLVVNGDILSTVNFANLLRSHKFSGKTMTICIREFRLDIPYGIVKTKGTDLTKIEEKPSYNFLINTGIYVLNPSILDEIEPRKRLDMPELIQKIAAKGAGVGCFPLSEFWLDIGRIEDYQRAQLEIKNLIA